MPDAKQMVGRPGYELVMALLAVISVAALFASNEGWVRGLNLAIWIAFVIDYAIRLAAADNRRGFVRSNLVDLIAILPADLFRLARVARLARLARAGSLVWRARQTLLGVLRTNGSGAALLVTGTVVIVGAAVVFWTDPVFDTYGDAVWWAIVTSTTVGYGDLSPETFPARVVAVLVMMTGIGTVGLLTASIANYFADRRHEPAATAVRVTFEDGTEVHLDAREAALVEALLRSD